MKTLLKNARLYTPEGVCTGYLAVEDKKISHIGKERPEGYFDCEKDMSGKLLMPGLFNCHTHTPMTLLRGVGSDLPLQTWLFDNIFPVEARLTPEMMRVGTELALLEMISTGTVSFTDMYFYPDDMVDAVIRSGMKANISQHVQAFDPRDRYETNQQAQVMEHLYKVYHGAAGDRIRVDACLHAEYTNFSEDVARGVAAFSKEHELYNHVHLSETASEHADCKTRHGKTPAEWFASIGMFDRPCTAAHCVWIEPTDMELFRRYGVSVTHNPTSNMKLGSGFAPVPTLLDAGVNVTLGTDGTASNNNLNLFEEMHLAAIIHNGFRNDAALMPARRLVEMATVNGAKAQGRTDSGVLEVGKRADLIALDMEKPHLVPDLDTTALLTYSAQGGDVVLTMVDGQILYENGEFLTLDKERILFEAREMVKKLYA